MGRNRSPLLRKITAEPPPHLLDRGGPPVNIQEYFERIGSGLAKVGFMPGKDLAYKIGASIGYQYTLGGWVKACAWFFHVNPCYVVTIMQCEQSVVKTPTVYDPSYSVEQVLQEDPSRAGGRFVKSRGGLLYVCGEWKMIAACGCGVTSPGNVPGGVEYLGIDRQVYHTCRVIARDMDQWMSKPLTAVKVSTEEHPEGELVECGNMETFVILNYTPFEGEPESRYSIHRGMHYEKADETPAVG